MRVYAYVCVHAHIIRLQKYNKKMTCANKIYNFMKNVRFLIFNGHFFRILLSKEDEYPCAFEHDHAQLPMIWRRWFHLREDTWLIAE